MNWFHNLRLRTKLLAGFALITAVAIIVGLQGMNSLRIVADNSTVLYENVAVPLAQLSDMQVAFQRSRVNMRDMILASTMEEKKECVETIRSLTAAIDTNSQAFEKTMIAKEVKDAFHRFTQTRAAYDGISRRIIELALEGKTEQAKNLMLGDGKQAAKEAQAGLEALSAVKVKAAAIRNQANQEDSRSAALVMSVLLGFGALAATGAAIFIARAVNRPLDHLMKVVDLVAQENQTLTEASTRIAAGDTTFARTQRTIALPTNRKDEIGTLAVSMKKIVDSQDQLGDSFLKLSQTLKELVGEIAGLTQATLEGNLSARAAQAKFQGGYRDIVAGFNNTLDTITGPVHQGMEVLRVLETGDLRARMHGEYKGEYRELMNSINSVGESLTNAIGKVAEAVSAAASASSQISASTEQMASGTQEQTSQSAEVASSVEQMVKTIMDNSRNASATATAARQAKSTAEEGGTIVGESVAEMRRIAEAVNRSAVTVKQLGESSNQIGEIIGVIDDIADQTNLLALNAAIEAARAGDQGRGFAVVADEVRKLAERTTKATKQIAEMIKKIQHDTTGAVQSMEEGTRQVDQGIRLADKAGTSLKSIVVEVQGVTDMVAQIAAASEEQSNASEQISKSVGAISSVAGETASATSQIARAAEDLNRMTDHLQVLVSSFRLPSERANGTHDGESKLAVRANGTLVSR